VGVGVIPQSRSCDQPPRSISLRSCGQRSPFHRLFYIFQQSADSSRTSPSFPYTGNQHYIRPLQRFGPWISPGIDPPLSFGGPLPPPSIFRIRSGSIYPSTVSRDVPNFLLPLFFARVTADFFSNWQNTSFFVHHRAKPPPS